MPAAFPELRTERLLLRGFTPADAPRVQELAGDPRIASTTLNIPHPFEDGMAESWIASHQPNFEQGQKLEMAVTRHEDGELIGVVGLQLARAHARGELGYWVGVPWWGQGYCTEAARAILDFGFNRLGLRRIQARHFPFNPASGRVMEKLGMQREGVLRDYVLKDGHFRNMVLWAILADEWEASP